MARFKKLDVPHQWKDEFTKYPHGYSIFESISKWVDQVNRMITNINQWNEYLRGFTSTFGEVPQQMAELRQEMTDLVDSINSDLTTITDEIAGLADNILSHLAESASQSTLGHIRLPEDWIDLDLKYGWEEFEGYTPQYRKNAFGWVQFRGRVKPDNTISNTIASIPPEYTPSVTVVAASVTQGLNPLGKAYVTATSNIGISDRNMSYGYYSLDNLGYYID